MKKREIKEDMRDKIQIKLDAQISRIFEEKKNKAIKGAIKENAKYGSMSIAWSYNTSHVTRKPVLPYANKKGAD